MENSIQANLTNDAKVDVLIIGAGLSGLTSALKILEKEQSLRIKILEASSKIGGQMTNSRLGELGGKWITEEQFHVHNILQELKIPLRKRILLAPKFSRCWDLDRGPTSVLAKHELERYIQELDLSCPYFRPGQQNPYKSSGSMKSHIGSKLLFGKSKEFMNNLVLLISSTDSANISYNDFMSLCYSCGGLSTLIDLYLECPDTLWEINTAQLLNEIQNRLQAVEILCKKKVDLIKHYRDSVEVCVSGGEVHVADVVIVAIPFDCVQEIEFLPSTPAELKQSLTHRKRGKFMITSFLAKYLEGHWRIAGYSGNLFLSEPVLLVGHEYRPTVYSGLTIHEEVIRSMTLQTLAEQYGEEMLVPIEYAQRTFELNRMPTEPFTTPWNRIIWSSSTLAATCYRGRLSGAVQSGLKAAMHALFIIRPQTVGWKDIADIQCTDIGPKATRLDVWLSSWNVYNFSIYGLLILGVTATLRFLYKNYYI